MIEQPVVTADDTVTGASVRILAVGSEAAAFREFTRHASMVFACSSTISGLGAGGGSAGLEPQAAPSASAIDTMKAAALLMM